MLIIILGLIIVIPVSIILYACLRAGGHEDDWSDKVYDQYFTYRANQRNG